jgi:hypothetical protein
MLLAGFFSNEKDAEEATYMRRPNWSQALLLEDPQSYV